jgi:hypothetical protein
MFLKFSKEYPLNSPLTSKLSQVNKKSFKEPFEDCCLI